uniref:Uncharacterized protein n=1 Tax=Macaca nemestrina TaxID=9545 RepID=A0A2K6EA33_MACNE
MFHYESWEDCLLDEDEDYFQGLREEDEEIDQFNDDTFGSGARLAELEEKLPVAVNEPTGNGEREEIDLLGDHEENLAERLSKMVIENELEAGQDPAMRAAQTRPVLQPQPGSLNSSIWDGSEVLRQIRGPLLTQEMSTVSVLEYALPQRTFLNMHYQDGQLHLLLAVLLRWLYPTEPMPIWKILHSKPVHVRPPMPPCYPAPYDKRMSPNQLYSVLNSSLLGHPFPPSVPPVLSPLQRAQVLEGAQQAGQMSPSQFVWVPGFVLLQGQVGQMLPPAPGFHAFSAPPSATPPPQPRTSLRQQQNRNQHQNLNGAGDRGSHWSSHHDNL